MSTIHLLTLVSTIVCTLVDLFLIYLILRHKPKTKSHWYLVLWIAFLGIIVQVTGWIIISSGDFYSALVRYQLSTATLGFFSLFYFFIKEYLELKVKPWAIFLLRLQLFFPALIVLLFPDFFINNVVWNEHVQFYLAVFNTKNIIAAYLGTGIWFYGLVKLIQEFKKSRSAVVRNRLAYLIAGGFFPLIGLILITLPIMALRRYPLDMWGTTIGVVIITYGILRYQLLEIKFIIRKGLIYSTLTVFVTGVYLFFSFMSQRFFRVSTTPIPFSAALSTALLVAFIFQPLQNFTANLIDKLFFRNPYQPKQVFSRFSEAISSTIEVKSLTGKVVGIIDQTIPVKKFCFFIFLPGASRSVVYEAKGYSSLKNLFIPKDHSLLSWLKKNDQVVHIHDAIDEEAKRLLKELKIELLIPLQSQNQLLGIIGLGPKLSEQIYTLDDLILLKTLGNQTAVALNNAFLFEQIKKEKEKIVQLLAHEREVDEVKSEFVMISSHHLRTPLTAIEGYLESLSVKKNEFSPENQKYLKFLLESVEKLSNLVENLLLVASASKGKLTLIKKPTDLYQLIQKSVLEHQPLAKQKKVDLKIKKTSFSTLKAQIDEKRILSVLDNLLDNAIKYSSRGLIVVSLEKRGKFVITRVKDSGSGIPEKELINLFKKFHQLPKFEKDPNPGMGLGLYISKLIIESHGGQIWAESKENQGSAFSFSLPI